MQKMQLVRKPLLWCLVSSLALPMAAVCAETISQFNIPVQPLSEALLEFSEQSDVIISMSKDLAEGKQAPAVQGNMLPSEALTLLLRDSGLAFEFSSEGAAVVKSGMTGNTDYDKKEAPSRIPKSVLEEVVVTAEKRAERIQNLPIAVSAFSAETLSATGVEGIRDLRQIAPSLQLGNDAFNTFVSIRGIGNEVPGIGGESGVAVSQDGVAFGRNMFFDADFVDVERVEVLRGPQGTISGRNATGGAINVYSKRPTETFEGGVKLTLGSYNRFATEGFLSGPLLGEKLMARAVLQTDKADGWLKNPYLNEELETRDKIHGRLSLLSLPSDNLEVLLRLEGSIDRSPPVSAIIDGPARPDLPSPAEYFDVPAPDVKNLEYLSDQAGYGKIKRYGSTLSINWDISPSARLSSTTGYWYLDMAISTDNDGVPIAIGQNPYATVNIWQLTEELTLAADLTDRLDLIVGTLYLRDSSEDDSAFVSDVVGLTEENPFKYNPVQNLTSYSLYSQLRYQLTDALRISAGARYTYDKKSFDTEQYVGSFLIAEGRDERSWSALTPRLAVDYDLNDDITLFANVARGFKAGGFNAYASPPDDFSPEFVWNYEAGLKATLWNDQMRLALTGFYSEYTDLQQNVWGDGDNLQASIRNAAAAAIKGLEIEIEALVTDNFHVDFSGTWLDTEFTELRSADSVYPELGEPDPDTGFNVRDLSGNELPRAPRWQYAIGAQYTLPIGSGMSTILRADYEWQDHVYFSFYNYDLVDQDAYGLLNLSLALESDDGRWRLSGFAQNVLDKRYRANSYAWFLETAGNASVIGKPRLYGLSLTYNF